MNNVTRMPSLGAGRLAKSIPGTGSVMKLLLGDKSRVLTQPHLTATDSHASTIQWIGFLNDLFYGRSYIAAPAELSIPFLLDEKSAIVPVPLGRRTVGGRLCDPGLVMRLVRPKSNKRSVPLVGRYPAKDVAVDRHMADERERQVSGHQRLAVRRQLPQKTDPDA